MLENVPFDRVLETFLSFIFLLIFHIKILKNEKLFN